VHVPWRVVIFQAPRFDYIRTQTTYGRLLTLLDLHAAAARELIQSDGDPAADRFIRQLSNFIIARDIYVHGLVAETEGNTLQAIDAFVESARISPDFSTGYAHCLTIAMQESKSNPSAARVLLQRLVEAQPSRPVAQELLQRLQKQ
jgi:hypothetical protein